MGGIGCAAVLVWLIIASLTLTADGSLNVNAQKIAKSSDSANKDESRLNYGKPSGLMNEQKGFVWRHDNRASNANSLPGPTEKADRLTPAGVQNQASRYDGTARQTLRYDNGAVKQALRYDGTLSRKREDGDVFFSEQDRRQVKPVQSNTGQDVLNVQMRPNVRMQFGRVNIQRAQGVPVQGVGSRLSESRKLPVQPLNPPQRGPGIPQVQKSKQGIIPPDNLRNTVNGQASGVLEKEFPTRKEAQVAPRSKKKFHSDLYDAVNDGEDSDAAPVSVDKKAHSTSIENVMANEDKMHGSVSNLGEEFIVKRDAPKAPMSWEFEPGKNLEAKNDPEEAKAQDDGAEKEGDVVEENVNLANSLGNGTENGTAGRGAGSTLHPSTTEAADDTGLPESGAAEEEHHSSLTIFFILLVVAIAILIVHLLIQTKFHYLPDSIAIVLIGALIGLVLKFFHFGNWKKEEAFPPNVFFLILLPPIIFEGGYNLHKGNFFHNIGSILVFAVFGTVISAGVVGGGVYLLGQAEVAYKLDLVESFAFGSLISAVDPVATLAIFQALDVDPILYMLVFGESMLNDAVSIVLTTTMLEFASPTAVITSGTAAFFQAVGRFCLMFFASGAIGVAFGLISAMLTKFVNLHKTPSLEVGMVFCFSYLPYALAEGVHLSGIMAILFCGIVMSHYTHLNLSPVSQITVQQTFRTIAFIAETCVFAYLGLAIFSFKVKVKAHFTIWSIVLILLGRACNIFPLSFIMNYFREHKITHKNQFIMWFSGLRGAIAFALSLHLEGFEEEKHFVLVTTTLIIVLFTLVFLGGSTMPLLKYLQNNDRRYKKKRKPEGEVSMSKTKEMGDAIDSEHLSELTEEDELHVVRPHLKGFLKFDARYLVPFFTKRFTQQEMRDGKSQVDVLTNQWQMEVRAAPSESEDEPGEMETTLIPPARGVANGREGGARTPANNFS